MDKTIRIVRGLLSIRNYNRVFTSKYCTYHKDGKDSCEKGGGSSETRQESDIQRDNVPENEIKVDNLKSEDEINLSSGDKAATSNQTAQSENSDEKVEPAKSEAESDEISTKDFPDTNEELVTKKLKHLIHLSSVESNKTDPKSDVNTKNELKLYKKKFEAENKIKQKLENEGMFASLLRKSAFIDLGDPAGKLVIGEIYHIVGNDLYIEFGWKFPAMCPRPKKNPEIYNIGAKVLLKINDLELTAKFLGDEEYTSLLEADCDLIHRVNEDGSKFIKPKSENLGAGSE